MKFRPVSPTAAKGLHIASSPFTHNQQSTSRIMLWVMLACIPGIAAQIWFFGYGVLIQVALAAIVALAAEGAILRLRKLPVRSRLADNSALLTALLLGISLPPLAPWWMIVIGTFFAIVIAKQLYGGLGQNPFNPAMVGYVVLLISFPVQMTSWLPPDELRATALSLHDTLLAIFSGHTSQGATLHELQMGVDGISQATPLDGFKTGLRSGHSVEQVLQQPLFGGALAGIAGLILTARTGSAQTNAGAGYELDAIAAVVIGGTSMAGGVGTLVGTFFGVLIIGVMNNGLDLLGVQSYYQQIIKGALIVLAVLLDPSRKQQRD